jgi:hypothetical protein
LNFIRSMDIKKAKYLLCDEGYKLNDGWLVILFFLRYKNDKKNLS